MRCLERSLKARSTALSDRQRERHWRSLAIKPIFIRSVAGKSKQRRSEIELPCSCPNGTLFLWIQPPIFRISLSRLLSSSALYNKMYNSREVYEVESQFVGQVLKVHFPIFFCHRALFGNWDILHGKKDFVVLTKSYVKIGITRTFCYNSNRFSSVNKTFGCCSKIFGCSNKKFNCCPKFCCRNKTIFSV